MTKKIQLINWKNVFRHIILFDIIEQPFIAKRKILDNLNTYSL